MGKSAVIFLVFLAAYTAEHLSNQLSYIPLKFLAAYTAEHDFEWFNFTSFRFLAAYTAEHYGLSINYLCKSTRNIRFFQPTLKHTNEYKRIKNINLFEQKK